MGSSTRSKLGYDAELFRSLPKICWAILIIYLKSALDTLPYFLRKSLSKDQLTLLFLKSSSAEIGRCGGAGKFFMTLSPSGSLSVYIESIVRKNNV